MKIKDLLNILTLQRPYGGENETKVAEDFLAPLGVTLHESGNWLLKIGEAPTTAFTAHLDTVHSKDGVQRIDYAEDAGYVCAANGAECLGADDAAGIYILVNMIEAQVPGLYIFCVGEERGCIGSDDLATHHPEVLEGISKEISFDRKGTEDVIVTQMSSSCCSDEFARELCKSLGGGYSPNHGAFTDSASFAHLVSECTNISVGYDKEHTKNEWLDINHLVWLKNKCLMIDWESLPSVRTPESLYANAYSGYDYNSSYNYNTSSNEVWGYYHDDLGYTEDNIEEMIYLQPEKVVEFIKNMQFSSTEWQCFFGTLTRKKVG